MIVLKFKVNFKVFFIFLLIEFSMNLSVFFLDLFSVFRLVILIIILYNFFLVIVRKIKYGIIN